MAATTAKLGNLRGLHAAGIFAETSIDGEEVGTLVLVVDRAKNLPNRKTMGKQNPYCAARLGKYAQKTHTDMRGGQTPRWDKELRFTVYDSIDYRNLKISIFNDDKRTDLIGETWVDLNDVILPGGGQADGWHGLNHKGRYAGELRLELTFYDSRPKPEKIEPVIEMQKEKTQAQAREGAQVQDSKHSIPGPRAQPAMKRRPLPADPTMSTITPSVKADSNLAVSASHSFSHSHNTPPRHATVTDPEPEDDEPVQIHQPKPIEIDRVEIDNQRRSIIEQDQQENYAQSYKHSRTPTLEEDESRVRHPDGHRQQTRSPQYQQMNMPRAEVSQSSLQSIEQIRHEELHQQARNLESTRVEVPAPRRQTRNDISQHDRHRQSHQQPQLARADFNPHQFQSTELLRGEKEQSTSFNRDEAFSHSSSDIYPQQQNRRSYVVEAPPPPPTHAQYEDDSSAYDYTPHRQLAITSAHQLPEVEEQSYHNQQVYDNHYDQELRYQDHEPRYPDATTPRHDRVQALSGAPTGHQSLLLSHSRLSTAVPYTQHMQKLPEAPGLEYEWSDHEADSFPSARHDELYYPSEVPGNYEEPLHLPEEDYRQENPDIYTSRRSAPIHRYSEPVLPAPIRHPPRPAPMHQSSAPARPSPVVPVAQREHVNSQIVPRQFQVSQNRQSLPARAAQNQVSVRSAAEDFRQASIPHRVRPTEQAPVLHPWDDGYAQVARDPPARENVDPQERHPGQRHSFGNTPGAARYDSTTSLSQPSYYQQAAESNQYRAYERPHQAHGTHIDGRALIKPRPISPKRENGQTQSPQVVMRKSISPRPSNDLGQAPSTPYSPDSFSVQPPESDRSAIIYASEGREPIPMYQRSHHQEPHSAPVSPGDVINNEGYIIGSDGRSKDPTDHLPLSSYAPEPEMKGNRSTTVVTVKNRLGPRDSPMVSTPTRQQPMTTGGKMSSQVGGGSDPGFARRYVPNSAPSSATSRFESRPTQPASKGQFSSVNHHSSPLSPAQSSHINSNNHSPSAQYPPIPTKYTQRGIGYGNSVEDYDPAIDGSYYQSAPGSSIHQEMAAIDLGPVSARRRLHY